MAQVARNLTDCVDGFLMNHRVLIRDRDCLFTARFTSALEEHYHTEPAHQGLGNERVLRGAEVGSGAVECAERLGAILKHHCRAA